MNENSEDSWGERFGGIQRLYGADAASRLRQAHVAVVGLGGVGSWAAEAIARSGVGEITLVDLDDVCVTNTNRQLVASTETVGELKARVMERRVRSIAPHAKVHMVEDFVTPANVAGVLDDVGAVIDAIDGIRDKVAIAEYCLGRDVPLVVSGAMAGRVDPSRFCVDDLNRTAHDPLLRAMRRALRKGAMRSRSSARWGVNCVYSSERPRYPQPNGGVGCNRDDSAGVALDCGTGMGTATHVTGTAGFMLAGLAISEIVGREQS